MSSSAPSGTTDPVAQAKLVSNERLKITATLLNNCAMVTLTTGVIVPVAAIAYGTSIPKSPYYLVISAGWLAGGVVIHLFTRWTLRRLES